MLVENNTFLTEVTKMFQKAKEKSTSSVFLTSKRWDGYQRPKPRTGELPEPQEFKLLVRAKLGKAKLSTVVGHKDINKFNVAYYNVLKGNMDGLKKKDKKSASKGKKKTKATQ